MTERFIQNKMNDTSQTHKQAPNSLCNTHTHTLCIHATVLGSLWSELLSDTKERNPEWCVGSVNAVNEIFTATEK